ncbi:MAG: ribonuclease HII [Cyclobacteriaceae bacterium]|nr:ribonuclease HII [Cyclobacteriaceae bacterium]
MLLDSFTESKIEAGCDEAGRGCLAGPVVAAAVIWPRGVYYEEINDSKKLTKSNRERLIDLIKREAIDFAVAEVDNVEIDRINILNASYLAMNKAVGKLKQKPELLLIDGNRFCGNETVPHECVIKGDGKYLSIAAASILAKVYRDELMERMAMEHPEYNWEQNMGYPTPFHKEAIYKYGITTYHRRTFLRKMDQLKLF